MQLSQTVEYALRAVVWLAENAGHAQTTQQIAEGCRMPASYLAKVLQPLARSGIVTGQRGLGGGFVLSREPDSLSVLEVVNAVEPVQRVRSCPLGISAHGTDLCNLHQTHDNVMAGVEKAFSNQSIGDLLRAPNKSRPLCPVKTGLAVGVKRAPVAVASADHANGNGNGFSTASHNGNGHTNGHGVGGANGHADADSAASSGTDAAAKD